MTVREGQPWEDGTILMLKRLSSPLLVLAREVCFRAPCSLQELGDLGTTKRRSFQPPFLVGGLEPL